MKYTGLILALTGSILTSHLQSQTPVFPAGTAPATSPRQTIIPKFLLYRYFLGWVNDLDQRATTVKANDSYEFAKPFQHAHLGPTHLNTLRQEAKSLKSDLNDHEAKAKQVINHYRQAAKHELQAGRPLPPAPAAIRQLEAARIALMVQHMINLQAALGPEKTAEFEAYLQHEFMPHVSVKPLMRSKPDPTTLKPF